jgi:hypothetical protein
MPPTHPLSPIFFKNKNEVLKVTNGIDGTLY